MNIFIAHLQLTATMLHGFATSTEHATPTPHPGHGTRGGSSGGLFDQFVHSGVRGAGWSMGSRIMHSLPIGVVILLAVVVGIAWLVRRRRTSQN